jgi:hypothetical protein
VDGLERGRAEGPQIAIPAALAPAGLVTVDDRAGPNLVADGRHRGRPARGHLPLRRDNRSRAEGQPVDGAQIPLDRLDRQPRRLAQADDQAQQGHPEALAADHLPGQHLRRARRRHLAAARAAAGQELVLGDGRRGQRQLDHLPGLGHPAAGQMRGTARADGRGVGDDRIGEEGSAAGKAARPPTAPLGRQRGGARRGLVAGHAGRTTGARGTVGRRRQPGLQGGDLGFQLLDGGLGLGQRHPQLADEGHEIGATSGGEGVEIIHVGLYVPHSAKITTL